MGEVSSEILDFLWTFSVFVWTACCMPLFIFTSIVISIFHQLWIKFLSLRHRDLYIEKDTTFRTLIDTHRNQGIMTVLLTIRGALDIDTVRRHLQEVVNRKDKFGNLVYPRLSQKLVAKWGTYAWQDIDFQLDQNLIVAPYSYKGRNITESNVQDCIGEIVSKYLPGGAPPWQVVIVPSAENHHYILVRVHHVMLNNGINIADLLPLIPPVRANIEQLQPKSPLTDIFRTPENIPYLKERLTEEFTNHWNEFISNYDPLEQTELLKNSPGFYQFLAIMLITLVSTIKESRKGFFMINPDLISRTRFFLATLKRESWKRRVSLWNFAKSIFVTINPLNVFKFIFNYWYIIVTIILRIPLFIYFEVMALFTCITMKYCSYPNTFVGTIYNYVPLFFYSGKEVFNFFKIIFEAPRIVLRELLSNYETIQTVTLCGRKTVAWSRPVKTTFIQHLAQITGSTETEIVLSAVSDGLSKYIIETTEPSSTPSPDKIPISCRNISSNFIFSTGNRVKPEDSIGGLLCMNLPLMIKETNLQDNLSRIRQNFSRSREEQPLTYLLSILQTKFGILSKFLPATFLSVVLKYLSKRYSVNFSEITTKQPNISQKTLWGQEVMSAVYWTPPQANISISMCINQYADHMVLGVMCDAQLIPNHPVLARGFHEHIEDLAVAVGFNA